MAMSDLIAEFILDVLANSDGETEMQRTELAQRFNVVPSQINYVISTRFSPEHGYIVESRRGGRGYIRIRRVESDPQALLMHTVNAIGDEIDERTTRAFISNLAAAGLVGAQSSQLILAATSENALKPVSREERERARASILKYMLINLRKPEAY